MLRISPVTLNNVYKNQTINKVATKYDSFIPSFKALEPENDDSFSSPVSEFFLRLKVRKDANKIVDNSDDIYRLAQIEQQSAQSIVNGKVKRILNAVKTSSDNIVYQNGKSYFVEKNNGKISSVTSFSSYGGDCVVEQVSVYKENGKKDIFITDTNNEVIFIRKGVKQIGPKSYLEDKAMSFKNGELILYYDNASRVNDGVVKAKSEEKNNIYKFKNGLLSGFAPKATYSGNDLYYDKYYFFSEDRLTKYMQKVPVIRGVMSPEIELDF